MTAATLILFDDDGGVWGPMRDLRASFELRTGVMLTRARVEEVVGATASALFVPAALEALVRERTPTPVNDRAALDALQDSLWINGRWPGVLGAEAVTSLELGQCLVDADGQVVAARLDVNDSRRFTDENFGPHLGRVVRVDQRLLISRPWHILDQIDAALEHDLPRMTVPTWNGKQPLVMRAGEHPIRVDPSAKVSPGVVLDASRGPIVVNQGATIGPLAVIMGPCYLGTESVVKPQACIGPCAVVGPVCKVGGEVHHAILHGYANKAHQGFLGHSLVGQWVNLGAGTMVSNLKNTYGTIRMELGPDGQAQDTGRTVMGAIIGDHVRTAIGTRILTGGVVSTGAVVALSGFAPRYAKRFGFYQDKGFEPGEPGAMVTSIQRMMTRRGFEPSEAELRRVTELMAMDRVNA
ncbi:MAG: hypothetical protein IT442_01110 [Phycisphaeraceae bacterium]|nr:hypothetical protein [Phycisphaeraceae bacterium]